MAMEEVVSVADFNNDELDMIQSLSPLDILAIVCQKALEKEYPSMIHDITPIVDLPISDEKKVLPFDLNLKPRTLRRPRTSPIDVHALLPCLHRESDTGLNGALKKRRLTDERESSQAPKKRRLIATPVPQPINPELPMEYRHKIEELGGSDVQFVIQKKLFDADVSRSKSRLTMPYLQCKVDFGEVEKRQVKLIHKDGRNELRETMMTFLRWDKVSSYVFNGSWNYLVNVNGLKTDDVVHVWTYMLGDEYAFALVKL